MPATGADCLTLRATRRDRLASGRAALARAPELAVLKNAMVCWSCSAWPLISSAVAASSSDDAGVLLRRLAELGHRRVDLAHARGLFLRRRRDLLHEIRRLLDARDDLVEQLAAPSRPSSTLPVATVLISCAATWLRSAELAHFGRHDGEALAVLAGARGFDRRVERQKVRLIRDVVDDADLLRDLLHRTGPSP